MRVDYHSHRFMETLEERIMKLLLEEKAILRILRTLDREYDNNKAMTQWSNSQYQRSIFEDDHIWLN